MRRRQFLAAVAGAFACTPRARAAQRPDPVIGYLYAGSFGPDPGAVDEGFWKGVAEQGYMRGRHVAVEYREAKNDLRQLRDLARDLVRREVSVIYVPASGPALHAAKAATDTIPIVFVNSGDPIRMGYVTSLSRPGGNVTGVSDFGDELSAKRLELIKQLVPTASRIGILVPNYFGLVREVERAREAVSALSLDTVASLVSSSEEIDAAIESFAQDRMDGLYFTPGPMFFGAREQLVRQVASYRLPAVYSFSEFAQAGGLMSYGISATERSYQAGRYVGLILNGANPAELPVRRLTKFELALNLSAARAIGLTVPTRFLALTDRVIE